MFLNKSDREYYQALLDKNSQYLGVFYVGVKSTGVFCNSTCPARKPKFENCEFFQKAQDALLASYRPCKRCRPLSHPNQVSEVVEKLLNAIEENPEKRWKDRDFQELAIDASTARRQFKRRFGMTFVEYSRARRIGIAMKEIRKGERIIDVQLEAGYESSSGFRDAFSRIMGTSPTNSLGGLALKASWLDTLLGPMLAIGDEDALYLLEFVDRRGLEREVERLRIRTKSSITPGMTKAIRSIESELIQYFEGNLKKFKTPLCPIGSSFQKSVWRELQHIPYGETRTYAQLAKLIENPSAFRAVANANGANQFAIIIPCHRVIGSNGDIGGYGGGVPRKKWLISHEEKNLDQLKQS